MSCVGGSEIRLGGHAGLGKRAGLRWGCSPPGYYPGGGGNGLVGDVAAVVGCRESFKA